VAVYNAVMNTVAELELEVMRLLKTQAYHDYCSAYHQKADLISEVQPIKLTARKA